MANSLLNMNEKDIDKLLNDLSIADTSGNKADGMLNVEIQKNKNLLLEQQATTKQKITKLDDTIQMIDEMSEHPRLTTRVKMSKFVEVDCLLNTSEYHLQFGDFSVLSSLKSTIAYCKNSIDALNEELSNIDDQLGRIDDQEMLIKSALHGMKPVDVMTNDAGTVTVYENGLVDIVENEAKPYEKPKRVARFKTVAERDAYLHRDQKDVGDSV